VLGKGRRPRACPSGDRTGHWLAPMSAYRYQGTAEQLRVAAIIEAPSIHAVSSLLRAASSRTATGSSGIVWRTESGHWRDLEELLRSVNSSSSRRAQPKSLPRST
jgi:hypothetical protein